jgi:hypothetical protein
MLFTPTTRLSVRSANGMRDFWVRSSQVQPAFDSACQHFDMYGSFDGWSVILLRPVTRSPLLYKPWLYRVVTTKEGKDVFCRDRGHELDKAHIAMAMQLAALWAETTGHVFLGTVGTLHHCECGSFVAALMNHVRICFPNP